MPPLRRRLPFLPHCLFTAETGTGECAILTRRMVSLMTRLSLPRTFLSMSSRKSARPLPAASAAGRNLIMSLPSCLPT
eukprot:979491-Pleurochrysis_carterae.AAC.2